jgi:hypothetical protein
MNHEHRSAFVAALVTGAVLVGFAACAKKDSPVALVAPTASIEDPRAVVITDTLHLGGYTGFDVWRPHGPYAGGADTTRWHILTWVEVVSAEPRIAPARLATLRPALRVALQRFSSEPGGPGVSRTTSSTSVECDSLVRTLWGYSLRRYLE